MPIDEQVHQNHMHPISACQEQTSVIEIYKLNIKETLKYFCIIWVYLSKDATID